MEALGEINMGRTKGCVPWNKGKTLSKEHCAALSKSHIGQECWRKGKKFGSTPEEVKEKIRKKLVGQKRGAMSKEHKDKLSESLMGRKSWNKGNVGYNAGERHYNWKGGKSRSKHNGGQYNQWRLSVFERDCYTCQDCGVKGCYLYAHHIKEWSKFESLRYNLNNGITLCETCHAKVDKYFARFLGKGVD